MVTKVCIAFVTLTSECALAQSKHLPLFSWKDRAHAQALGQIGGAIAGPLLRVAALFLLVSPAMCHAQNLCLPVIPVTSSTPSPWYVGQTIYAVFPNLAGTDATNYNFALVTANGNEVPLDSLTNCGWNSEVGFPFVIDPAVPTETATAQYWLTCDPVSGPCSPPEGSTWLQASFPVQIVGCPTPAIASVLPSTWFAGKSYDKVTITGTGFTTEGKATAACPVTPVTITAADGSAVPISAVTVENKTTITLTGVAPPAADRTETATVTAGTAPNTGTFNTAQILGNQILFQNNPVSSPNNPPPVVVGQQIALTTPPLPDGIKATSTTWTVDGTRISGYSATRRGDKIREMKDDDFKKSAITFYWVNSGDSIPVTYTYCVDIPGVGNEDGKCSIVANAAFEVDGGGTMTSNPQSQLSISPLTKCVDGKPPTGEGPFPKDWWINYGSVTGYSCLLDPGGSYGMVFTPSGAPDGGTYSYVQLINSYQTRSADGPISTGVCNYTQGIDGNYPYRGIVPGTDPPQAEDAPGDSLTSGYVETISFNATMFLMWTSSLPNSIAVPIGYQSWGFSGGASQDLTGTWQETTDPSLQNPYAPAPGPIGSFVQSADSPTTDGYTSLQDGYPLWSKPTSCN
jgi:hypothetical protein